MFRVKRGGHGSWCAVPEYNVLDPLFTAMTFEEVRAETGRSVRTVQRWIQAGKLPVHYSPDGTAIFVRRDVLRVEAQMSRRPGRPGARPPIL